MRAMMRGAVGLGLTSCNLSAVVTASVGGGGGDGGGVEFATGEPSVMRYVPSTCTAVGVPYSSDTQV